MFKTNLPMCINIIGGYNRDTLYLQHKKKEYVPPRIVTPF